MTATADTMESADWVVHRVALGGSVLSRALQTTPTAGEWLAPRPASRAAWIARVEAVRAAVAGSDWLTPLAPAIAATGMAAERLGRAAAGGVVVTTGQQPGLFGGPAYTFSKALSALGMADALEAASGVPVAPVFWAATDDADWVEAAVAHFATPNGLETVTLDGPATDGIAMADVPLGPMAAAHDALRRASGSAAHEDLLRLVEQAYVPHATIGAAYVQLLRALLEPLGIAVLDAAHVALRHAADPFLRRALQAAPQVHEALAARTQAIGAAGYRPQVDVMDDLSLVFRTQGGVSGRERDRVRTRVPISEASRVVREADVGSLGANVLLRPILERALLPTVAYHAGPGEYAYFAQVGPIAQAMQCEAPLAVPRWSGEVRDGHAVAVAERLGVDEALLLDPHAAETLVARAAVDVGMQDAIERLRVAVETQVRAVREASGRDDDPLVAAAVVDGLGTDIGLRLDRFERRVVAAVKRREASLMREVAFVRAMLRPDGHSPERKLTLIPLLARFGPAILDAMRQDARAYAEQCVDGH
jgi:bacillithiol biosynthesis cysteine-adding enzyme BshC